jgi:xylulokinase
MTQSLPKIVWLIQNEPQTAQRTARFLDVQAFLIRRLTGEDVTSIASADPMGLIDMQRGEWAVGLIEDLGLSQGQFAQLALPGQRIGLISRSAAAVTGLPEGLTVVAGAGDGHCAGLGANATVPERAYLNLGTAVVSGAVSDTYLCDRAFRTLIAPVPGKFIVEHVLRGGVFTVQWFVDKFAADLKTASPGNAERQLEELAAGVPSGSEGLMAVPYWNNVMSPYWDPNASGITIGWSGAHGREHFYRAILEAIAFEQRLVGDAMMVAAQRRFSEYVTMGGGSKSSLWCQILADVTGVPIVRSTTTEATCLGAGILAAAAVGWYSDVTQAAEHMTGAAERFEPVPEVQAFYDRLYREVYQPLFPTLQVLVGRLTELTHGAPGNGA